MMVAVSTAIPAINRSLRPRPVKNFFGDAGRQTSRDLNIRNESKTDAPLMSAMGRKRTLATSVGSARTTTAKAELDPFVDQ